MKIVKNIIEIGVGIIILFLGLTLLINTMSNRVRIFPDGAFKQAIASKHMDINKYAPRFGDNYLNDKRILKTSSITMNKLVAMSERLDIEVELTLRNASDNVPNPMDKPITVILTGNTDSD